MSRFEHLLSYKGRSEGHSEANASPKKRGYRSYMYRHLGTTGAVGGGRAIKTIVASGSRPAPKTPLNQRAVERTLCRDQSAHAGGWITRGEALICTTDE